MAKEYLYAGFELDDKKLKFETDRDGFTEVKFKIRFPDNFEFLKAYFDEENLIRIDFKGLDGCTLAENLEKSSSFKNEIIKVKLDNSGDIPSTIKLQYEMVEVENCKSQNFVPETAGGGILVGTGG